MSFQEILNSAIAHRKTNKCRHVLTHWGRVTHICVSDLTIIGSDNGLSPSRRQAIFWTNAGILLIGPLGTNFSEILIEIHTLSSKKIHLKMSSAKWRLFGLGFNELIEVHLFFCFYSHIPCSYLCFVKYISLHCIFLQLVQYPWGSSVVGMLCNFW